MKRGQNSVLKFKKDIKPSNGGYETIHIIAPGEIRKLNDASIAKDSTLVSWCPDAIDVNSLF